MRGGQLSHANRLVSGQSYWPILMPSQGAHSMQEQGQSAATVWPNKSWSKDAPSTATDWRSISTIARLSNCKTIIIKPYIIAETCNSVAFLHREHEVGAKKAGREPDWQCDHREHRHQLTRQLSNYCCFHANSKLTKDLTNTKTLTRI